MTRTKGWSSEARVRKNTAFLKAREKTNQKIRPTRDPEKNTASSLGSDAYKEKTKLLRVDGVCRI